MVDGQYGGWVAEARGGTISHPYRLFFFKNQLNSKSAMRIAALLIMLAFGPAQISWAFNYDPCVLYGLQKPSQYIILLVVTWNPVILPDKNKWTLNNSEDED